MRAQDPNDPTKTIEVTIPTGPQYRLWVKVCNYCGCGAGGCVEGPDLPPPSISKYAVCPKCGGNNLRLELQE